MKLFKASPTVVILGLTGILGVVGVTDRHGAAIAAVATVPHPTEADPLPGFTPFLLAEVSTSQPDAVMLVDSYGAPVARPSLTPSPVQILTPTAGAILDVPATTVMLRYPADREVELRVNGELVDPSLVGRTAVEPTTHLVTQTWYGVPLNIGQNTLTVTPAGSPEVLADLTLQVRGTPATLTLETRGQTVPADGRSSLRVQGQLLDDNGNPSNWNSVVTLTASDGTFMGTDHAPDTPGFQVEAVDGRYTAELQASLTAHLVQLEATASGLTAYNQVQFVTQQRPPLMTGALDIRLGARGTDLYGSFREFLDPGAEGYELALTGAVFATGNLGKWLFTGAYNSDRALNDDCTGNATLFRQTQACGNVYPSYGDASSQEVLTPSIDRAYLRLERTSPVPGLGVDYVMWGDYTTTEFTTPSQLYTATSRSLHGFKAHYNWGDLAITGFFANNIQGFQRDTLAPDGTSGTYLLSQRPILAGSEEVYLEVEALNRPGTVLARERLERNVNYDIDYERGTVWFRTPIQRVSIGDFGEILAQRIVVTYQFEGQSNGDTHMYGGRLHQTLKRTMGQESWLGASYLRENQGNRTFELYGADARIALGETAEILAEYAHSSNTFDLDTPIAGAAYRLELDGAIANWFKGRAYIRHTDAGFSNLATESFRPGQTRYGAQANVQVLPNTTVRFQFDRDHNHGQSPQPVLSLEDVVAADSQVSLDNPVDTTLTTVAVGVSQTFGDSQFDLDWLHRDRTDHTTSDKQTVSSDQLRTRLTTHWSDDLTAYAHHELNVASDRDPLYPNRTLFGVDWQLLPGIHLGVGQVFLGDTHNDDNGFTTINLSGDYQPGEATTLYGQMALLDGQQFAGRLGIDQGVILSPGLRLDLGYERVFSDRDGTTTAATRIPQPWATGLTASTLPFTNGHSFHVGASYTDHATFQATTRFEHRTSSRSSNTVVTASALGQLSPAISTLVDFRLSSAANQSLRLGTSSTLKVGLAYRDPQRDTVNALLRYEYRKNPLAGDRGGFGTAVDTAEHVLATEAIYAPDWRWELYGKYALRSSTTRIGGLVDQAKQRSAFTSDTIVHLAQLRATYRLGYAWDVTGEARWLGSSIGYSEFGAALELGYYITPDLRLYAGYSLGEAYDRDFAGANRSAGGSYIGITAKLGNLFKGFGTPGITPSQANDEAVEEGLSEAADTADLTGPESSRQPVPND